MNCVRFAIGTFPPLKSSNGVALVPYCICGNREPGNDMQTWFRTETPTLAESWKGVYDRKRISSWHETF